MLVSREYAAIAERLDYVQPIVFGGKWTDLRGGIHAAKQIFENVKVTQTFGELCAIQKRHPSFQYDQWDRAGMLDKWGTLPLRALPTIAPFTKRKRTILFADHSQSSPFPQAEELVGALKERFPKHELVRLSTVRERNPIDILNHYNAADLLVTTETMHAHLCAASRVPVIALVADKPSCWHGSAWHPRFAMQVRYADFDLRKADILRRAEAVMEGREDIETETIIGFPKFAYNPSVLDCSGIRYTTARYHPDAASWRSELVALMDNRCFPIHAPVGFREIFD